MDFDYSCLGRLLNDVLFNSVINCKFYRIVGNIWTSWATIGISGCTVYYMCLILWSLLYCFSVMWIIFSASFRIEISAWNCSVFPTTIRSNLMVSKWCCFYSVTSVHAFGRSLCQWLLLLLSFTFTVNCQSKTFVIHIAVVLLLCYCK